MEVMQNEAAEDLAMQGIFKEHLKAVKPKTIEDLKAYLLKAVEGKFDGFALNAYWSRAACGVKAFGLAASRAKAPEVAYFGRVNPGASHNSNMAMSYACASLLVSWLLVAFAVMGQLHFFLEEKT